MSLFTDTMLSLDPCPEDILYRIRRLSATQRRVLYVTIDAPTIIPEDKQTYGPSLIKELSKLKEWEQSWTTLRVYRDGESISCELDHVTPHRVPKEYIYDSYPLYNLLDCEVVRVLAYRVSMVLHQGRVCILKVARFAYELPALIRELQAYHTGCVPAPKFLGYAFEEHADRVVGFLVEFIEGRPATPTDIDIVQEALDQLHRYLIHNDLYRYNILMTAQGPMFIDFETAILRDSGEWSEELRDAEKLGLAAKLADMSGIGRPRHLEQ